MHYVKRDKDKKVYIIFYKTWGYAVGYYNPEDKRPHEINCDLDLKKAEKIYEEKRRLACKN